MHENKRDIIKSLLPTLQMTREGENISDIRYERAENGMEWVIVTYSSGNRKEINVSMDSGIAMLRDTLKYI